MTQFYTLALVPADTTDIEEAVGVLMAPYDVGLTTPYKGYFYPGTLEAIMQNYNVTPGDVDGFVARLRAEGKDAGVDEQGVYKIDTSNPHSKWDAWGISKTYSSVDEVKAAGVVSSAVVTPTGEWHERPWDVAAGEWGDGVAWEREYLSLLDQYPTAIPVLLICHS